MTTPRETTGNQMLERAAEMRGWGDFWAVMGLLGFVLCVYAGVQAGRVPVTSAGFLGQTVRIETQVTAGMLIYFWVAMCSVVGGFFWRAVCISHSLLLDATGRVRE